MKWITREKVKVDRVACPWLIKNFIDKDAEFLFVPSDKVLEVAKLEKAISYDAQNADFTHSKDGKCTFEVLVEHYKINDKAILELAKVVHGADISGEINFTQESAGLKAIAEGFQLISKNDFENLEKQFYVYDAFYAYFKKHSELN
ncbi:chromate resistance protein [bacterium]|nr:chromate resistance protein [bacterium]